MFDWLRKHPKEELVGGEIAFLGLADWWMCEFTPEEREIVRSTYSPLGTADYQIDKGKVTNSTQSVVGFAANLAGWFTKEDTRHIGYKFLAKADEYRNTDMPAISLHYAMQARCQFFYRWRNHDDFALDAAIEACERGISVSKEAAAAIKRQWGDTPLGHHCFHQLAVIEEKRGNFQQAIDLCDAAQGDGWAGDWEKRKARLAKKLAKVSAGDSA
jgi:hypothetical protein